MNPEQILAALGGKSNIKEMEACITRLRLKLADVSLMDDKKLRSLGAVGIVKLGGGNTQVVFGTEAELIEQEIRRLL